MARISMAFHGCTPFVRTAVTAPFSIYASRGQFAQPGMMAVLVTVLTLTMVAKSVAYDSQSTERDGPFHPTEDIQIDLALAAMGDWNSSSHPVGSGVYDAELWAVVFQYTTIDIPEGVTVTFSNHPKGAPVVWLASGNVTIDGTVNLSGDAGTTANVYAAGGPGGFAGGIRVAGVNSASAGFGPGGGLPACGSSGGGFGTVGESGSGVAGGSVYGSPRLLPLIGGSGGGGSTCFGHAGGGGGGGGAILIASSGIISLGGLILADGGAAGTSGAADGSGGAIRLVADQIQGDGELSARSGDPGSTAGLGRIRVETLPMMNTLTQPSQPAWSADLPGPLFLFPESQPPQVRIAAVMGIPTPADPFGNMIWSEDVLISAVGNQAAILIEANNIDPSLVASVDLRLVPAHGNAITPVVAPVLEGTVQQSSATAMLSIPPGRSVVQVRVRKQE